MCLLDDMIIKFAGKCLPHPERFSKDFIKRMLLTRPCLIVCDGLDEWTHPSGKCEETLGIPHNNYEKCTVLITTRPWKISTIGLPPNLIDRHVEISHLDEATSKELKSNAVKILSQTSGKQEPDLKVFDREIFSVKLGEISLIPYILLQLICIWFDGLSIGKSKCETYSNTIEITLKRGLKKKNAPTLPAENPERRVPECMRHNKKCKGYVNLLFNLEKLAFYTLFQKIKKSSLVIERTTVLKYLTKQELEFCLKTGLLSQRKDSIKVSKLLHTVSFQHKSIQEFLAALYITSEWNNGTVKSTILEVCSSLSSILEMENIFVFVCGMNPAVYTCISDELQKIVDLDSVTDRYRADNYNSIFGDRVFIADKGAIESYQSMQLQCFQESERNGHQSCDISLHDIIIHIYCLDTLKTIINFNIGNVKSLLVSHSDETAMFMQSLDPGAFTSLETLRVRDFNTEPVWLVVILTESALTLKCLALSQPLYEPSPSGISITALTGLTCLQSLYLGYVRMTHGDLKCLHDYIKQSETLKQNKLWKIGCSDHKNQHCDVASSLNANEWNLMG